MRRLSAVCLVAASLFGTTLETRRATSATQDATTRSIHLKGLKDRVTISRDERGIPNIEARNDEDLYFAQGYATAAGAPQGFEPEPTDYGSQLTILLCVPEFSLVLLS
jgi:acyl-homoserine lactone acylase PvdQ